MQYICPAARGLPGCNAPQAHQRSSSMIDHDVKPGHLDRCQICGSHDLDMVFDCGLQPLCDSLLDPTDLNRPEKNFPLRLVLCTVCANAQLDYIVDGSEVYYAEYPYRSGITRELREYH